MRTNWRLNGCGCGGSCAGCNAGLSALRLGRRMRLRGLGDDTGDGFDSSGGGDGGAGDPFAGSSADASGLVDSGTGLDQATLDAINAGTYAPAPTDTFSQADPGSTVPLTNIFSTADSIGGITTPDGEYITPWGDTVMPNGTVYESTGWTINPDGSAVDPSGNVYPANSPTAQAAQQQAGASKAAAASGGGASGGAKGGGSGSQPQTPWQQIICAINPRAQGCPQSAQAFAAQRTAATSTSSFSSFLSQYGGWIALGLGAAIILPPLLEGR